GGGGGGGGAESVEHWRPWPLRGPQPGQERRALPDADRRIPSPSSGLAEGVAARALLARPACDERARAGAGASLPPSARQWRRGRSRGREEEEEQQKQEHKEDEERWNRAARAPGVGPRGCLCSRRQPALPCGPPRNHYGDGDEPGKLHDSADCGWTWAGSVHAHNSLRPKTAPRKSYCDRVLRHSSSCDSSSSEKATRCTSFSPS
ncbi:unnamed protein product, partial [Prorocentrum cordatum]